MNPTPRSQLTPAERDAAMFEASRLRAMSLRREAIDRFWSAIARFLRSMFHLRKGERELRDVPAADGGYGGVTQAARKRSRETAPA